MWDLSDSDQDNHEHTIGEGKKSSSLGAMITVSSYNNSFLMQNVGHRA